MQFVLITLIKIYQYLISPWLGNHCRFHPSCSHYAVEALSIHGTMKGSYLALKRLLKCHPFHAGGIDLVPPKKSEK